MRELTGVELDQTDYLLECILLHCEETKRAGSVAGGIMNTLNSPRYYMILHRRYTSFSDEMVGFAQL